MSKLSNVLIGFLTGAVAGATIGILYAPDKGRNTRDKIQRKTKKITNDVAESIGKQVDNMKQHVNDFIEDAKSKFSNLESEVKNKASDATKSAAEMAEEKARQAKKSF